MRRLFVSLPIVLCSLAFLSSSAEELGDATLNELRKSAADWTVRACTIDEPEGSSGPLYGRTQKFAVLVESRKRTRSGKREFNLVFIEGNSAWPGCYGAADEDFKGSFISECMSGAFSVAFDHCVIEVLHQRVRRKPFEGLSNADPYELAGKQYCGAIEIADVPRSYTCIKIPPEEARRRQQQ